MAMVAIFLSYGYFVSLKIVAQLVDEHSSLGRSRVATKPCDTDSNSFKRKELARAKKEGYS
ncbi:hypothetical protein KDAU_66790 [Dictyobacter aurantiacus]|uniref:Uncharacterized protein n=1 Tax=Dictyobacter aurantiacus TaxID=1936993 RepID=A0A401ZRD8_9CHLR|nr:hypothetical protein KDAU_66790 [Dictyobacter aurantiacus]